MQFSLRFTSEAKESLEILKTQDPKKYKKVLKTLGLMEANLRHSGLKAHQFARDIDRVMSTLLTLIVVPIVYTFVDDALLLFQRLLPPKEQLSQSGIVLRHESD